MNTKRVLIIALAAAVVPAVASAGTGSTRNSYLASRHVVAPAGMASTLAATVKNVPSFSRQTGLPCSACHYQFPQLTPFGRLFKLNGYSLMGLKPVTDPNDKNGSGLSLLPIPPLSMMFVTGATHTTARQPGTQNNTVDFPQQFSFFLGGTITPHIGTLIQATYAGAGGSFGIDNSDIRYTDHQQIGSKDLLLGLTLHNNPTVQDVWNTTPAWGYPFISSGVAPSGMAGALIDGALGQQVVGFGGYALWDNFLYLEATGYRTAQQPGPYPVDSTAAGAVHGVSPYWRVALQHQFGAVYGEVGTYGMYSRIYPAGITGPTNDFTDVALDAQIERPLGNGGVVVLRSTWINERTEFAADLGTAATQLHETLNTARINATFEPNQRFGFTLGYFATSGTADTLRYAPAVFFGSANGKPATSGVMEEIAFNPWQNTRIGIQGVQFAQFNGASSNYDGAGRPASGNNTIYLFAWLAF